MIAQRYPVSTSKVLFRSLITNVLVSPMKSICARVVMRTTEEGGRMGPLLAGRDHRCIAHFPDHPRLSEHDYDCFLLLGDSEMNVAPGSVAVLSIGFLSEEEVLPHLSIGTPIQLLEGKVIGEGIVIECEWSSIRP